jgi:hypothetical protein
MRGGDRMGFVSLADAARRLGYSPRLLVELRYRGKLDLPYSTIGRSLMVPVEDLPRIREQVEAHRQKRKGAVPCA